MKPQGNKPHEDRGIPGCLEKMTELVGQKSSWTGSPWQGELQTSVLPHLCILLSHFLSFFHFISPPFIHRSSLVL